MDETYEIKQGLGSPLLYMKKVIQVFFPLGGRGTYYMYEGKPRT